MLFDTHAHYYASAFDQDRDQVLASLPGEGVGLVLCPGNDLDTSRESIRLAEKYPYVYAAGPERPPGSTRRTLWACPMTGWTRWRPWPPTPR